MNPVTKFLSTVLSKINSLIDSLDNSTIVMIKQGYIAFIVILVIIGGVIGFIKGKDSARIKRPPLAPNVKHVFERDIYKSREDGYFDKMLREGHMKTELKTTPLNKIQKKSTEKLVPEFDDSILDSKRNITTRRLPDMKVDDRPIDSDYRGKKQSSDVSLLKKKKKPIAENKKSTTGSSETNKSRIIRSTKENIKPKQIINNNRMFEN